MFVNSIIKHCSIRRLAGFLILNAVALSLTLVKTAAFDLASAYGSLDCSVFGLQTQKFGHPWYICLIFNSKQQFSFLQLSPVECTNECFISAWCRRFSKSDWMLWQLGRWRENISTPHQETWTQATWCSLSLSQVTGELCHLNKIGSLSTIGTSTIVYTCLQSLVLYLLPSFHDAALTVWYYTGG